MTTNQDSFKEVKVVEQEDPEIVEEIDPLEDRVDELPPMTEQQIQRAIYMLKDSHRLQDTPLTEVLPFVKPFQYVFCCMPCRDKSQTDQGSSVQKKIQNAINSEDQEFESSEESSSGDEEEYTAAEQPSLIDQLEKQDGSQVSSRDITSAKRPTRPYSFSVYQKESKKGKKDPFLRYGLGTKAYFNMQAMLIRLMCVIVILVLPIIIIFSKDAGLSTIYEDPNVSWFERFSFANVGFASAQCSRSPIFSNGTALVIFQCQNPTQVMEGISAGVIAASEANSSSLCRTNTTELNPYNEGFSVDLAFDAILNKCKDKTQCQAEVTPAHFYEGVVPPVIGDEMVIFYSQVACQYTTPDLKTQRQKSLVICCLGVLICLIYSSTLTLMHKQNSLKNRIWDAKIITLSDFSVKLNLKPMTYRNYLASQFNLDLHGNANISSFKDALIDHIEKGVQKNYLKSMMDMAGPNTDTSGQLNNKVACLRFAFDNGDVIKLLGKRGRFLENGKFLQASQTEQELTQLMKTKHYKIQTPVCAFITFQSQRAPIYATLKPYEENFYNQKVELSRAREPSDIIWENRAVTRAGIVIRKLIITLITLLLSVVIFYFIIQTITIYNGIEELTSPAGVNCQSYESQYSQGNDFEKAAYLDWKQEVDNHSFFSFNRDNSRYHFGILSCFCQQQHQQGIGSDHEYTLNISGHTETEKICHTWGTFTAPYGSYSVKVGKFAIIGGLNAIVKGLFIAMANRAGFHFQSERMEFIKNGVFFLQFMNIGILIPLAGYNAVNDSMSVFDGKYREFDNEWVSDIGFLMTITLFLNSTMLPLLGASVGALVRNCKRSKDQKRSCCCSKNDYFRTQQKTVWAFLKLYNGPELKLHLIYSSIMTIVLVSMLFGPIMPMLFPMALVELLLLYSLERYSLAYSYRQPPMYDNILNTNCLLILKAAPIFYSLTGMWVFTNQQVYQNVVVPFYTIGQVLEADHKASDLVTQVNPGTPFLIMFFLLLLEYIYRLVKRAYDKKTDKREALHDKSVTKFYWDVITPAQKNKWLMEELCCQLRLGIRTIPDETLSQLGVSTLTHDPNTNYMVSRYAYDMLATVRYQESLLYINGTTPDAISHIVSEYRNYNIRRYTCDIVVFATRYAYFQEFIMNGGMVSVASLYESRGDSRQRYEELCAMFSGHKITRRLLEESKDVLLFDKKNE